MSASITTQWLFDRFVQEHIIYNKTPSTIRAYEQGYRKMVDFDPLLPTREIAAVNKQYIVQFTGWLTESNLSIASVNHHLRNTRAFLYWCMDNDYLLRYKVQMITERETPIEVYTKDELAVLIRKPLNTGRFTEWRTWAVINWILGLGSRASTVVSVLMDDIDMTKGTVMTRHNKNGRVYTLRMTPQLRLTVVQYLRHRTVESEYLFCAQGGGKLLVTSLNHSISKYNKARGITKTSTHLLRHTFGAMWAENGGDVFGLQHALQHSDIRVTQRYVSLFGSKKAEDRFIRFNPLEQMKKPARNKKE